MKLARKSSTCGPVPHRRRAVARLRVRQPHLQMLPGATVPSCVLRSAGCPSSSRGYQCPGPASEVVEYAGDPKLASVTVETAGRRALIGMVLQQQQWCDQQCRHHRCCRGSSDRCTSDRRAAAATTYVVAEQLVGPLLLQLGRAAGPPYILATAG